jgi:methyl-branched lipid omega-hydroxylase
MDCDRPTVPLPDIDLSSGRFWKASPEYRDAAFATLRREAPVRFFAERPAAAGFDAGPGYWALTRYDDIVHASRHPGLFRSGMGADLAGFPAGVRRFHRSMIHMDDPRHARLRHLIQRGFTARMVRQIEDQVRHRAKVIIDDLLERHPDGECDFVDQVAAPLPLQVTCEMMGIPAEDQAQVFAWSNVILGFSDPEHGGGYDALLHASEEMFDYAKALGRERSRHPRHDLVSELMHAEVDGERLSVSELAAFFTLLVVAGNETTRNAISHGIKALTDHPRQREIWWRDPAGVARLAVEEIVRWATPVRHFRRTASRDTEIRGVRIAEGDKVVLWYASANRDEEHFSDPCAFDVRRAPNPHLGFGGGGPHFCLGASLARVEISAMFDEIRRRAPDLVITGEPVMLRSYFTHGIKRMPCAWTAG